MRWILGSFRADFLFLMVPGLISLAIEGAGLLQTSLIYIVFASAFADSGHIYTTVWRTYFHPEERKRSVLYLVGPFAVAAVFFLWSFSKLPYLWAFVVYATIHHNLKQYYGITRWYETLNRHRLAWSGHFAKALMFIPVVFYHFRSDAVSGFYSEGDLFLYPNATLLFICLCVYACVWAGWIAMEVKNYRAGFREWNRVLSILFCAGLYGMCFGFGRSIWAVLFPLVIPHGIGYMAMTATAMNRTRAKRFPRFKTAFFIVATTALTMGLFEFLVERRAINFETPARSWVEAALIGFYLVPLFSHFIFDMFLWRKTHWESALIYGLSEQHRNVVALPIADKNKSARTTPLGDHRILDYWGCSFEVLDDIAAIKRMFEDGLREANATVIDIVMHKFSPQGVTGIASIAESHVSIHTWPELGYAAIDVFTCGTKMKTSVLLSHFETVLKPSDIRETQISRGTRLEIARSS